MQPRFTDAHVDHYREHGFVLIENFLSSEELDAAREEIETYIPGWLDYAANPDGNRPEGWDEPRRSRRNMRFPFRGTALNAITLHPELRRFAATMSGSDELFCEQSDLTYKCTGHYGDADQHMHLDYPNHTLVYPPADPCYWQTTYLLYYTDVDEGCAPTAACSWRLYNDELRWPAVYSPEERAELYENEVRAEVPAGSLLAYSVRTFHRGTVFTREAARVGHFISYAPAKCPWVGIVGWSEQGVRREFQPWIERATVEERTLLGFPEPGDPYWSEETLRGVQARFPGMDLSPYAECVGNNPPFSSTD
jgi:hypothetical protein